MKQRLFCLLLSAVLILSSGCAAGKEEGPISKTDILLDTVVTVTIYSGGSREILDDCFALAAEYEKLFSRTLPGSDIYELNARHTETVSPETAELIELGLYYSAFSGGRFDISIGSVSSLWDFSSGSGTVPDSGLIKEALRSVGYEKVSVEGTEVTFSDPGTMLDLGAIAKGYIADRMKEMLAERGVTSAIINLGGNTLCIGEKPDGTPFRVGIQYPFRDSGEIIAVVNVRDISVVSSGSYERYIEEDGKSYHHILDPSTGYSADSDMCSVTVLCPSSAKADALSTICFIIGSDAALELAESMEDTEIIIVMNDYTLRTSSGADAFLSR